MLPLTLANIGEEQMIHKVGGSPEVKKHLEDMGFVAGGLVTVVSSLNGNVIVKVKEAAGQHFSAQGGAAALHFDGRDARVLRCAADLAFVLYPEQGRQKQKVRVFMEVICAILVALFGIGFGIFMALQPEDAIALRSRGRYTQVPEPTEEYIRLTRLEGIVLSVLCAVLLVVLLFAPK